MDFERIKISLLKGFLVMGMVWLSMTIIPSSAETDNTYNPTGMPICWAKIDNCEKAQPGYDPSSSAPYTFNKMCCPVFKEQMKDVKCFCSFKSYALSLPSETSSTVRSSAVDLLINQIMADCKVDGSFQDTCKGVKSGSKAIAPIGVIPIVVFIWAMVVSY